MSFTPINKDRLLGLFFDAGLDAYALDAVGRFICADPAYMPVSKSYVALTFPTDLHEFSQHLQEKYEPEDFDCDDFSRGAAFLACLLFAWTKGRPAGCSIAVAEFWYQIDNGGGGHAINAFIVVDSGKLAIVFFEPQAFKIVELTRSEISSATLVRF